MTKKTREQFCLERIESERKRALRLRTTLQHVTTSNIHDKNVRLSYIVYYLDYYNQAKEKYGGDYEKRFAVCRKRKDLLELTEAFLYRCVKGYE